MLESLNFKTFDQENKERNVVYVSELKKDRTALFISASSRFAKAGF